MKINILLHGNSEGFQSDFMQYLNDHLIAQKKECYGFDFKYIVEGKESSLNQKEELKQLLLVIKNFKNLGYKNINIIGKSLGGVIALNKEIIEDPSVKKVFVLGFPLVLGFPADLSLLKIKPVIPNPYAVEEYAKIFNDLGNNIGKIKILEGTNDASCPTELIETLREKCKKKLEVFFIENASHSFRPVDDQITWEVNMDKILNIINLNV